MRIQFRKKRKITLTIAVILAMFSLMTVPSSADAPAVDYTITWDGTFFFVNGGGTAATLTNAIKACTETGGDGILCIQFGNSTTLPVSIPDTSLKTATYTGSIIFTIPESEDPFCGLWVPDGVTAIFDNLTVSNASSEYSSYVAVTVDNGGTLNIQNNTSITSTYNSRSTSNVIRNDGILNISGGTIQGDTNLRTAIYNTGTLNVSGGTVQSQAPSDNLSTAIKNYGGNVTISGGALVTAEQYGIAAEGTSETGSVAVNGGTVEATGSGGCAILTRRTDITVTGGIVQATATGSANYGISYFNAGSASGGTITVSGGTVSCVNGDLRYDKAAAIYLLQDGSTTITNTANVTGSKNGIYIEATNNTVVISGGTVESTDATDATDATAGAAVKIADNSTSSVTVSGGAIKSANDNTLLLTISSTAADNASYNFFGKNIYRHNQADIVITGDTDPDDKRVIDSSNKDEATVSTTNLMSGKAFIAWTSDGARATAISTENCATIESLTTGENASVENIYLKAGDPVIAPAVLPTGGSFTDTDNDADQIAGTISWTAADPTTGIDGYKIYWGSDATTKLTGHTDPVYTVSGVSTLTKTVAADTALPSGAAFFLVYSYNAGGNSSNCLAIQIDDTIVSDPNPPGGGHSSRHSTPSGDNNTDVIVNGETKGGVAKSTTEKGKDGRNTTTLALDENKVDEILSSLSDDANNNTGQPTITVPVPDKSDIVIGELNGQMIKNMENNNVVLELKTETASYSLPAQQIDISAVSKSMGQDVKLSDIKVQIEIAKPNDEIVRVVEDQANKGSFTLVLPPVEFKVSCTYEGKTVEVNQFKNYVERTVAIPEGIDASKITTGVVVESDGTVRHVPTKIVIIDGKYYAQINSLTNSIYSVIWHPIEFKDVEKHWAKDAVNEMGSRMVISGTGGDMFEPDRNITRAEFAAIIVRALGLGSVSGKTLFKDVSGADWYNGSVITAAEYKIISGYGNGKFGPNDRITREQAMSMVANAMKLTGMTVEFTDVESDSLLAGYADSNKASEWAMAGIVKCVKSGLVSGKSDGTLAPKDEITRAEVAVVIRNLLIRSDLI